MMSLSHLLLLICLACIAFVLIVLHWWVALQLLLGVLVVLMVYKMSLAIMHHDRLVVDMDHARVPRLEKSIMDGYALTASASDRAWSTIDQNAVDYLPLLRSLNRKGGAQFTYQFWMYVGNSSKANVAYKTILLRGSPTQYAWTKNVTTAPDSTVVKPNPDGSVPNSVTTKYTYRDVLVKCPQISFGPTADSFQVSINTIHDPDTKIDITPYAATDGIDGTLRQNALKLALNKWALHTFVFEDNVAISDFEDGIRLRYYLNDVLYHTARIPSTMRQNNGDFYLLPTFGTGSIVRDCRIGDLRYYNYALDTDEVRRTFGGGPPRKAAVGLDRSSTSMPLYLTEYNKLDIYNT